MTAAINLKLRVQKGIPIPVVKPRGGGAGRKPVYPWREMVIGDSFLFPESVGRAAYAAAIGASRGDKRFVVRSVEQGFRCWRVE